MLQDLGDLAGARAAFERALSIDENAFGPKHPNVAIDVNNLGSVLQDLGDLPGARAAYERALAIDERVFGPQHPDVARDLWNLGYTLEQQGDLAMAKGHYERALSDLRGDAARGDTRVQSVRNILARVEELLRQQGVPGPAARREPSSGRWGF